MTRRGPFDARPAWRRIVFDRVTVAEAAVLLVSVSVCLWALLYLVGRAVVEVLL